MGSALALAATPFTWLCSAVCCACSCFSCCCTGSMGPGGIGPAMAKFVYVVILGIATLMAYVIGEYGVNQVEADPTKNTNLFEFTVACADVTGNSVCSGDPAIFRVSAAAVIFFSIMLLGTAPVPTFSGDDGWRPLLGEGFHRGYWGIKLLIFFGLAIGFFFIPGFNDDTFVGVARFVSFIFLVVQVLVLIDFAYTWNDTWLERSDIDNDFADGSKGWFFALIFFMTALFICALVGIILLLVFYAGCAFTQWFTVVTTILIIISLVLCLFRERLFDLDNESLAPAAVVAAYAVFLTWSAAQSNPNDSDECLPRYVDEAGDNGLEIFLGITIGIGTLVWTAFTVSNNAASLLGGGGATTETAFSGGDNDVGGIYSVGQDENGKDILARDTAGYDNDGDDEGSSNDKFWVFHLIMITASFYMSMVLTNWGVSDVEAQGSIAGGEISMWVKIAATWGAVLLYIWTLIAEWVMPDRFG
mmetsp:Transcript_9252/g.10548  ORF Transcript_9252/g.10548 Transcript_9252/m.10548 type:complete len:474 (+) Transcript_9252:234-1655(+)